MRSQRVCVCVNAKIKITLYTRQPLACLGPVEEAKEQTTQNIKALSCISHP